MVEKNSKAKPKVQSTLKPKFDFEDRIEDVAIGQYEALGYVGRLPDALVSTYLEFKHKKDKIHPGPLSPEGLVTVLMIASIINKES